MTPTAPLTLLTDFSDRLSPMVVKELRQSLRTRLFVLLMLILHGLLILVTLAGSVNDKGVDTSWALQGLTILCLCVIMPLRGFSALASEVQRNTLDMLVLTRLSAARIVFGKWASIALQSLLVALSLMPYVVASYVFGGADLLGELKLLALKWLVGIVIAAGVVCLSTQKQFALRAVVIALALAGPALFSIVIAVTAMWGGPSPWSAVLSSAFQKESALALWSIFGSAWTIFAFLSLAATRIAPAASNLALVKRPVHALVMAALILIAWWSGQYATVLMAASVVVNFATVDALVEREIQVPSVLLPFHRRGVLGRIAGWLLAPGWPNGMLYSWALAGLLTAGAAFMADPEVATTVWLSIAEIWMCGALLHLFKVSRSNDLVTGYIVVTLLMAVVKTFVSIAISAMIASDAVPWAGAAFPSTVSMVLIMLRAKGLTAEAEHFRWWGLGISCVWPLLLTLLAALAFRRGRSLRKEARRLTHGV